MTKHVVAVNVSQENNNNNMCDLQQNFFSKRSLVCEDTWQPRCSQWSSRWTGWPGTPPHPKTGLSPRQQEDNSVTAATWQCTKSRWKPGSRCNSCSQVQTSFVTENLLRTADAAQSRSLINVCVCDVESNQSRQRPRSKYSSVSSQRLKQRNDAEQEDRGQRSLTRQSQGYITLCIN